MRVFVFVLMVIHGTIHLLGFVKAFKLAEVAQITRNISQPVGLLWLLAAVLFIAASVLFISGNDNWWMLATPSIVVSQILIFLSWNDAKFSTIANLIILLPLVIAILNAQPSSFKNTFKSEVQKRLSIIVSSTEKRGLAGTAGRISEGGKAVYGGPEMIKQSSKQIDESVVAERDLEHLPQPLQKYLRYVGVIGKPKVRNFRAVYEGDFSRDNGKSWLKIKSQQYNFYDDRARLYYIESELFGIPFDGLHIYAGNKATMQIKIAEMFKVADAKGPEMNRGETVTMFNDMCLIAPATLIDKSIQWEPVDSLIVRARFTNAGNTIAATLYFNKKGEMTNFVSDDRYQSADGKTYKSYRWSTPVKDYKNYGGYKLAHYGEARWRMPDGEHPYAKAYLKEIEYNCEEYK
jgi:hypothetical protein